MSAATRKSSRKSTTARPALPFRPESNDLDAQIATLQRDLGEDGVAAAQAIIDRHPAGVVKLAFKMLRKTERHAGPAGLGKYLSRMIEALPESERPALTAKFLAAKAARKGK